ncbi:MULTISPECIES: oxidoreductase [Yersinia]|uniref:oxidoreductase n=1 Tax=Yersinia TaxID=629 RepID=UPI0005E5B213|nr:MULTISPECIES: oxidoreductase [Yersinia]EKN3610927.1 oxidoreductase [Yersinia enterocolitica]EKN4860121.1 oxidoreductase [Yersinia enterocolitica]EKN4905907.1 oxidoreductase [Yersinia enterocolitica]ELI8152784.1 oxidoreductase [Yersinia enterocolitica]MDA5529994.1 oxidoreductase [Yersinia enterocolitica]
MSTNAIRVQVGPANYFSFPGAIGKLSEFYPQVALENALWIYGARALAAAIDYLPAEFNSPQAVRASFSTHCSESTVADLVSAAGSDRQVVIGIGGGAVLDTAKVVARKLGLPLVAIPTIAATCAAWTPLSVWYNDAGQALNFEIFKDANHLVLVEPRIILQAPVEYLLAGIGDTLAKWYEAVVLSPQPETLSLTVRLGLQAALEIRNVLLKQSEAALQAVKQGELTQDFLDVVDAIIAGGGMVGGLGERYTRVAAAHAVHNGLTLLPQTEHFLHGTKVAYGILVQTALLEQDEALQSLIVAFNQLGLPTHLAALDVDINDRAAIELVINRILKPSESIHYLPVELNSDKMWAAIERVETAAHADSMRE